MNTVRCPVHLLVKEVKRVEFYLRILRLREAIITILQYINAPPLFAVPVHMYPSDIYYI